MPGNISQVKRHTALIQAEVIDKVARQIQRRNDLVSKLQAVDHPGRLRQHVHLHLPPGVLVFLEQAQAGLELAVGGFEFFPVAQIFHAQLGTVQRPAYRVLKYREVFQRLDQVVGSP